jgi:hypothetical protein
VGIPDWVAIISVVVSFASLLTVFIELRRGRHQRRAEALIQIYDTNRELLTLGFEKPELFDVIGAGDAGHRYLQLWLNQIALIVELRSQRLFTRAQWESLESDIGFFAENPRFHEIWPDVRRFYPRAVQDILDAKIVIALKGTAAEASRLEAPAA